MQWKTAQFAKVLPSNYTSRVISSKFHPANILRYTVLFHSCVIVFVTTTQKMIQDLELAKKETWEEKERLSARYEDERTKNLASKVSVCAHICKNLTKILCMYTLYSQYSLCIDIFMIFVNVMLSGNIGYGHGYTQERPRGNAPAVDEPSK